MKSLLPLSLFLLSSTPAYSENIAPTTDPSLNPCKMGLIQAIQRIEREPNIKVAHLNAYEHRYSNAPFPERNQGLGISFEGENTLNVMASKAILTEAANYIFAGCSDAGIITFGQYRTDLSFNVGLNSDNTTMFFDCVAAEDYQRQPVPWGKKVCL